MSVQERPENDLTVRLDSYRRYFTGKAEAFTGPFLMSGGVVAAVLTLTLGRGTSPQSTVLAMIALMLALTGSAIELAFLLALYELLKALGRVRLGTAWAVVVIALLMAGYIMIIGIPVLGILLGLWARSLGDGSSLVRPRYSWAIALATIGLALAAIQLRLASDATLAIESALATLHGAEKSVGGVP